LHVVQQLRHGVGGEGVAREEDLGGAAAGQVVIGRGEQFQQGAGPQIGTADAHHDEDLRLPADDPGGLEDPVDLFPVVGPGQIHPAGKLPAQALAVLQQLAGLGEPVQPRGEPVGRQERARVAHIKFKHKQTPLKLGI